MHDGLMIDDRNLQDHILECQDLACIYSVVTRGSISVLGEIFCPWCSTTKSTASQVSLKVSLKEGDTIEFVKPVWHMLVLESLLRVSRMLPIPMFFQNDNCE